MSIGSLTQCEEMREHKAIPCNLCVTTKLQLVGTEQSLPTAGAHES